MHYEKMGIIWDQPISNKFVDEDSKQVFVRSIIISFSQSLFSEVNIICRLTLKNKAITVFREC